MVKKSVKKTTTKKNTISTTESSSITSSKAASFENSSVSNGSMDIIEQHHVEEKQQKVISPSQQVSITNNNSHDSSSGKGLSTPESPQSEQLENGTTTTNGTMDKKKTLNGGVGSSLKKKTKKSKKSDEKENNHISVVSALLPSPPTQLLSRSLASVSLLNVNLFNVTHFLHFVLLWCFILNLFLRCLMFVKLNGIKIFNRLSLVATNGNSTSTSTTNQIIINAPTTLPMSTCPPTINTRKTNTNYNDDYGCDMANNKTNKYKRLIISSTLQLHEDDLSRIDVKSLVRVCCFGDGLCFTFYSFFYYHWYCPSTPLVDISDSPR